MNHIILAVFTLILLAGVPGFSLAAELEKPQIAATESGVQVIRYLKKKAPLYNYRWKLKKNGGKVTFSARGDNNKSGSKRIEWVEKSVMELTGKGLRTLSWSKDSSGDEQESWKVTYDWAAGKMRHEWRDRASGKTSSKTVELGPDAVSADAMYFILRGFPFEKGKGTRIDGDFVLTDGQVLSAYVVSRGDERIATPMGEIDTYRLEMKLKGALGPIAPKMYMWFTKSRPHLFVRYEGKENGLTKPRTVNELVDYTPRELIAPVEKVVPSAPEQGRVSTSASSEKK